MLPQKQSRPLATLARWALALLPGFLSLQSGANSCVWYADDDTIRQVETSSNEVTRVVPLRHSRWLVMNATDCGVWTLDQHDRRLLRYDAEGALALEIRVRDLDRRLREVEQLQLDPYDGSLWVADERRLYHVASSGQLLGSFTAPGEVRRLRVALDQSLWVLGKRELWHFDAQGALLASYPLARHLAADARHLTVDSLGGVVWLADEDDLAQLKLADPHEPPLRIRLRHKITGFALDPLTGNVWVAQKKTLLAYTRAGQPLHAIDLEPLGVREPEKLAFDPVSRSLWVGAERTVARFSDTGQLVVRFPAKDGDEALGVPAFTVEPTLTLVRPPENALTNSAQPRFTLGYGAACNGQGCGFGNEYLSTYQLSAALNGEAVGARFVFDQGAAEANFTPGARLPEGLNHFSAQVTDRFGHRSNTITNAFTVDTIAPRFVTLGPAAGSVFQSPQVTIQGSVDDPAATVILQDAAALGNTGPNPQGRNFAFPITLRAGLNTVVLTALDPAGNAASAVLQLTFIPVSVTIEAPANGASVAAQSVLVTGTFQGPPNTGVTVNGIIAAIDGNRFYAQVPLQAGVNLVNVVATSPEGATATQGITVTSTGIAPITISANPVYGVAPFKVTFELGSTTGRAIKRIEADFNGDGTVDFTTADPSAALEFTYSTPGLYTARFTVLDDQNTSHVISVVVQAEDATRLDQILRAGWNGFTQSLVVRDKAAAMKLLTASAQARYGRVFDALLASLPAVAASLSAPERAQLNGSIGEYFLTRRAPDGTLRLFLIYFVRDADGVWRLDTM